MTKKPEGYFLTNNSVNVHAYFSEDFAAVKLKFCVHLNTGIKFLLSIQQKVNKKNHLGDIVVLKRGNSPKNGLFFGVHRSVARKKIRCRKGTGQSTAKKLITQICVISFPGFANHANLRD